MHNHQTTHNKLVKKTLQQIAKKSKMPFEEIRARFVAAEGDMLIQKFWESLYRNYPDCRCYTQVFHCPDCKRFDLE